MRLPVLSKNGGRAALPLPLHPRSLILVALTLLLAACSVVRTVYNQTDNLAYWYLNRALDLDEDQAALVRSGIGEWQQWHRQTQLPVYAQFLRRSEGEARQSITPALACTRRAELETLGRQAVDRLVPQAAALIVTLKPAQLRYLAGYMADSNEDYREDYLQPDPQERREATLEFVLKVTEFFYGDLDDAQRERLAAGLLRMPIDAQVAYDERLRLQREWLALLERHIDHRTTQVQTEQALRTALLDIFVPADAGRRERLALWIRSGCELTAATHNGTKPEQRQAVVDMFRAWGRDFRILAVEI